MIYFYHGDANIFFIQRHGDKKMVDHEFKMNLYRGLVVATYCFRPTNYDNMGCDGLYIKNIEYKPFAKLFIRIMFLGKWLYYQLR